MRCALVIEALELRFNIEIVLGQFDRPVPAAVEAIEGVLGAQDGLGFIGLPGEDCALAGVATCKASAHIGDGRAGFKPMQTNQFEPATRCVQFIVRAEFVVVLVLGFQQHSTVGIGSVLGALGNLSSLAVKAVELAG